MYERFRVSKLKEKKNEKVKRKYCTKFQWQFGNIWGRKKKFFVQNIESKLTKEEPRRNSLAVVLFCYTANTEFASDTGSAILEDSPINCDLDISSWDYSWQIICKEGRMYNWKPCLNRLVAYIISHWVACFLKWPKISNKKTYCNFVRKKNVDYLKKSNGD